MWVTLPEEAFDEVYKVRGEPAFWWIAGREGRTTWQVGVRQKTTPVTVEGGWGVDGNYVDVSYHCWVGDYSYARDFVELKVGLRASLLKLEHEIAERYVKEVVHQGGDWDEASPLIRRVVNVRKCLG
jgi:hypothetical protein